MKNVKLIAMSGATGFVGTSMCRKFKKNGWKVIALGRKKFALSTEELAKRLQGVDVIVNLAGAPVIRRWSEEYKKVIYESRITLTRKLVSACNLLEKPPHLFLSTSAIGCYSATGTHTEDDNVLADDFLGHLTRDWEQEALRAKEFGCRLLYGEGAQVLTSGQTVIPNRLLDGGFQFDFPSIEEAVADCLKY